MASAYERIGRYALFDELGSGGMASVHLGRLVGPVGFTRTVAVKRMHAAVARNAEFVAMFVDEARLAARIHHPNVVSTLDVVQTEDELFLVMDYVHGESLAHLLAAVANHDKRIPPAITVSILAGALHGLHAAHEATSEDGKPLNIVHRDVSPDNILVGTDGVARVFDFGVAKAQGRLHSTSDGQIKGKLAYMAPEQLDGEDVNREADIYAAGVVLWEALAGRRLFKAKLQSLLLAQVLDGATELPSRYTATLPEGLDEVTMRALNLRAKERYATARELAVALESCLPPASAIEVGRWVAETARERLFSRQLRLAAVESQPGLCDGPDEISQLTPRSGVRGSDGGARQAQASDGLAAAPADRSVTPGDPAPTHTLVSPEFEGHDGNEATSQEATSQGAAEGSQRSVARPGVDEPPTPDGPGPTGTQPSIDRLAPSVDSEAGVPTQSLEAPLRSRADKQRNATSGQIPTAPSSSVVASIQAVRLRSPRRFAIIASLALAVGALASLVLLLPNQETAPPIAPTGPPSATVVPPTATPSSLTSALPPPPAASPAATASATVASTGDPTGESTASTKPILTRPGGTGPGGTATPVITGPPSATATASAPAPSCDPPYIIDGRGIQRLKPHCL
jgi:serine/threonine protein kinase